MFFQLILMILTIDTDDIITLCKVFTILSDNKVNVTQVGFDVCTMCPRAGIANS